MCVFCVSLNQFCPDLCCLLLLRWVFFSTKPRDCLGRTSPKWHVFCDEWDRKTLTLSQLKRLNVCVRRETRRRSRTTRKCWKWPRRRSCCRQNCPMRTRHSAERETYITTLVSSKNLTRMSSR